MAERKRVPLARIAVAAGLVMAGALFVSPGWTQNASAGAAFQVRVSPMPGAPQRALCTRDAHPGAFGAEVTVVCSTGALLGVSKPQTLHGPVHGGAHRYTLQVTRGDHHLGTIDAHTTSGTILSWQVIELPSREYVELTLGW